MASERANSFKGSSVGERERERDGEVRLGGGRGWFIFPVIKNSNISPGSATIPRARLIIASSAFYCQDHSFVEPITR